jgi:hypothetical protein
MKTELNTSITTRDHVQWIFPKLVVQSGFGKSRNGTDLIGINFGISIFKDSMDTLNHIGMEIDHIKSIDDKLIVVVYDRRADRTSS